MHSWAHWTNDCTSFVVTSTWTTSHLRAVPPPIPAKKLPLNPWWAESAAHSGGGRLQPVLQTKEILIRNKRSGLSAQGWQGCNRICSSGPLVSVKSKATGVQGWRTGLFHLNFSAEDRASVLFQLINKASPTVSIKWLNHPKESPHSDVSLPSPREGIRKWTKHEQCYSQQGQPHRQRAGSTVLPQKQRGTESSFMKTPCCSLSSPKLGVPNPRNCFVAETGLFFSALFPSIKRISCPLQDHPALKSRNWSWAQWDSFNNNSHFSLRICMHQNQLAFATNVT